MTIKITKEIKCLKCGSFIHDTERCYVWNFQAYCSITKKFEQDCECINCAWRCKYCNSTICNFHSGKRCNICNEFLVEFDVVIGEFCIWNHDKSLCKYCSLPILYPTDTQCPNSHDSPELCSKCNVPKKLGFTGNYEHYHDGNICKICGTLLNYGKCIFKCVGGGQFCVYCNYEGVVNAVCLNCNKVNSGYHTKCAKK